MKFKVILYCVLVCCSQIVVSHPYAEEAIRHRAYQPANWPLGHNGPEQYHGANVARPQHVNSGFQQQNKHEYYTHPGRNYDYTFYKHVTPRNPGDERQEVLHSGPEVRPHQFGLPNRRPHNQFVSAVATATIAPAPLAEERTLVTSVREPYHAPSHHPYQGANYFPPSHPQYRHTDGNQPIPIAREPYREREQYREREPFREQGLHRELLREREQAALHERELFRERNQFHNPIVENSGNIRHLEQSPPQFGFHRPAHFEPKSEALAVANAPQHVPENNYAPIPTHNIELPSHNNAVIEPIKHEESLNVENTPLKNMLTSTHNRFVVIHPNGTVEYLQKLDPATQNNRNYHVVYSGHAGNIELVNGGSGHSPQLLVPPPLVGNDFAPPPPIDTHFEGSINDKSNHGFPNPIVPMNPIVPGILDYVTTPSPFHAGYLGHDGSPSHGSSPGHDGPPSHDVYPGHDGSPTYGGSPGHDGFPGHGGSPGYEGPPSHDGYPGHDGYPVHAGYPGPLFPIDHTEATSSLAPFKDVDLKTSPNDNNQNKPLNPTSPLDTLTHPDHVTPPSLTTHSVEPDFEVTNKDYPVYPSDSTVHADYVTTPFTPSTTPTVKHHEESDNSPIVPLIPKHHDHETTTPAAPHYSETPKPHDVTKPYDKITKDDIITISPIELSTDNVRNVSPMQKSTTEIVTPSNDKKDADEVTETSNVNNNDKSDDRPDKDIVNFHHQLNVTKGNEIDKSTAVTPDTEDIVTHDYDHTQTPFLSVNKKVVISDNDSYGNSKAHNHDSELSLTTTSEPDSIKDDHKPIKHGHDHTNKHDLIDSLDISKSDKKQEHYTTSAPDHFDKDILKTFHENIININQPTNPTNNDNPTTATNKYIAHTDVPEITDDWLSVTTSSPIQSDIKSVGTTNPPGDDDIDSKSPDDVMVKFSIPSDGKDKEETINIAIEVPTEDTDNTDGDTDGGDTLVLSIDTKSGHNDDNIKKSPIDVTHTAVIQTSDGVDKNSIIDLSAIKEKPVVWFRTTDSDFFEKLTKNKACDIVYLFQLKPQPMVEKDTRTTHFANGTVVEDITQTIYKDKDDPSPQIIKTSRIIQT